MNQLFDKCFHAFANESAFIATNLTRVAAVADVREEEVMPSGKELAKDSPPDEFIATIGSRVRGQAGFRRYPQTPGAVIEPEDFPPAGQGCAGKMAEHLQGKTS
jgi:hypothetical protein